MIRFLIVIALLIISPLTAYAQETGSEDSPATRIEVDENNHIIRFFINGEEAARLTEKGFEARLIQATGSAVSEQGPNGSTETTSPEAQNTNQEGSDAP